MDLARFVPDEINLHNLSQSDFPRIAKDRKITEKITLAVRNIPTTQRIIQGDSRNMRKENVHLILTSPPYWTIKKYRPIKGQLGVIEDYEKFLDELDKVCLICESLLNAYEKKPRGEIDSEHEFHVLIPVPSNRLNEYIKFLMRDPEFPNYVTWHYKDVDEEVSLKERLFLNIAAFSFHALVTYFVTYALPIAMKALRRLIDVIDPYEFKEVVLRGGGLVKRKGENKLQEA